MGAWQILLPSPSLYNTNLFVMHRVINNFLYSKKYAPYIFVLPFLVSFSLFFIFPIISTIIMSFQKVLIGSARFIGFDNYKRLINESFFNAIRTNIIYTVLTILYLIPVPIVIAVALNSKLLIGRNAFRAVLFLPSLISIIVSGVAFRLLFGTGEFGFVNSLLQKLGLRPINWLLEYWPGMFIMVGLACWRWTGVNIVYFLSGLQNIPKELYESADIDGANALDKFFYITLPLLKPIIIYVLTISIYGGFAMFGESFVYWNETMPGDIGLTIVRYIYQEAIQRNDLGYGSSIGIVLLVIVFGINIMQLKFFGIFRREQ